MVVGTRAVSVFVSVATEEAECSFDQLKHFGWLAKCSASFHEPFGLAHLSKTSQPPVYKLYDPFMNDPFMNQQPRLVSISIGIHEFWVFLSHHFAVCN